MATRGRPRVHPKGMSPADVKRLWDKKMRNDGGQSPGEPMRKPCVIYLSEEARKVISDERRAAKEARLSPVLTSKLIEDLLHFHAANPLRPQRAGLSSSALRQYLDMAQRVRLEAMYRLEDLKVADELQPLKSKPNIRTIRRLMEADAKQREPTVEELQALFERLWRQQRENLLPNLRAELLRLFRNNPHEDEQLAGMRHLLLRFLTAIFTDSPPSPVAELNWKASK